MALDPVTALIEGATTIVNKIFPDASEEQKSALQAGLAKLTAETELAKGQQAINVEEAKSDKLFIAGWRPFIGWTCGIAFAYTLVVQPFLIFLCAVFDKILPQLPNIDTNLLGWALGGILGLGAMRTTEKIKGVAR